MKRILRPLIVAAGLVPLFCGCGRGTSEKTVHEVIPVKVMEIKYEAGVGARTYVGSVEPAKSVVVSAVYPGTLVSCNVSEGDAVSKGDTLAVIDSRSVRSSWEMAHATLDQAEDGYQRLTQVHGSGSVADVKMVEIQTQLAKARAAAEAADKALEDCTVKAPFDGVVGEVFAETGVDLTLSQPLLRLLDISSVDIGISVPESEYASYSKGDAAYVSVPAAGCADFRAFLRTKGLTASALSHSYRFVLDPQPGVSGLMPGMVCKVTFDDPSSGIVIPASVVRIDMDGQYVWTVLEGKVRKTYVDTGGFSGNGVIVKNGLSAGDKVITEGMQKVSSGMSVRIVE